MSKLYKMVVRPIILNWICYFDPKWDYILFFRLSHFRHVSVGANHGIHERKVKMKSRSIVLDNVIFHLDPPLMVLDLAFPGLVLFPHKVSKYIK